MPMNGDVDTLPAEIVDHACVGRELAQHEAAMDHTSA
jgi:hypothetical protein